MLFFLVLVPKLAKVQSAAGYSYKEPLSCCLVSILGTQGSWYFIGILFINNLYFESGPTALKT